MGFRYRSQSLLPEGLIVDRIEHADDTLVAIARSSSRTSVCPICGRESAQVHSHYERHLGDLPAHGRQVGIRLQVRRFRCRGEHCPRRIFAERLDEGIAQPWARRSARLQAIVHHVALMLGGRPGQSLARRLLMPVSNDTLLRAVRRRGTQHVIPPTVIGIDDWAWRRNQRYGTIICDLERRRTIALLPDREPATAEACFRGSGRSKSSLVIVAAATGWRSPDPCRKRHKSPIDGISWKTPAKPSLRLCASP
jgi:transposase